MRQGSRVWVKARNGKTRWAGIVVTTRGDRVTVRLLRQRLLFDRGFASDVRTYKRDRVSQRRKDVA